MIKNELNRLLNGVEKFNNTSNKFLVDFEVKCKKNAEIVLKQCKEVLKIVLENSEGELPSINDWMNLLPQWFLDKCAKEISMEEAERRLELTIEERKEMLKTEGWELSAWIYWFNLENRQWFWWDVKILNADTIIVTVECLSYPFPWGALEWLFISSGAVSIEEI